MAERKTTRSRNAAAFVFMLLPLVLAGCAGNSFSSFGGFGGGTPIDGEVASAPTPPPLRQPAAPPLDLAGRWTLAAPGSRSCVMTLTAQPGTGEGAVAPSRGCPYNFYTTRKWIYEDDTLVLRDHKGEQLGKLATNGSQFEGSATSGQMITLAR